MTAKPFDSEQFFCDRFNTVYGNITTDDESISKYKWSVRYSIKTGVNNQQDHFNYFTFGISSRDSLLNNKLSNGLGSFVVFDGHYIQDSKFSTIIYNVNTKTGKIYNNYNGDNTSDSGCDGFAFSNNGIIHLLLDMDSLNTVKILHLLCKRNID